MHPEIINYETDKILITMWENIMKLIKKKFKSLIDSLKKMVNVPYNNLLEKTEVFWSEIDNNRFQFSIKEDMIEEINNLQLDEFISFFEEIFVLKPKKISVQVIFIFFIIIY